MSLAPVPPTEPPSGVNYGLVLTGRHQTPARNLVGAFLAVASFALLVPLVLQLLVRLGALLRGEGDLDAYRRAALSYEIPDGIVAGHLALATLLLVSVLLFQHLHGRQPRWLVSVYPGWRGRYLLICLALALVVLNAGVWASFLVLGRPAFSAPEEGWWWFALVIVLFSPLQAAAEEFFFRGYLLQTLSSATASAWVGVVGSALLFALFHGAQNPALFAHRFCFGLLMGALVLTTGGLEAPIAAHVINNVCAFGYAIFTGGIAALKATSAISPAKAAFDIAGFALFAAAAWWVGRRLRVPTLTP